MSKTYIPQPLRRRVVAASSGRCAYCHACNEFKGTQTEAKDPLTGESMPLFHPREQEWPEHFHRFIVTPLGRKVESQMGATR